MSEKENFPLKNIITVYIGDVFTDNKTISILININTQRDSEVTINDFNFHLTMYAGYNNHSFSN